jgi:hypothetical protein
MLALPSNIPPVGEVSAASAQPIVTISKAAAEGRGIARMLSPRKIAMPAERVTGWLAAIL